MEVESLTTTLRRTLCGVSNRLFEGLFDKLGLRTESQRSTFLCLVLSPIPKRKDSRATKENPHGLGRTLVRVDRHQTSEGKKI